MSSKKVALLIGDITHAKKEWEQLSDILELKVRDHLLDPTSIVFPTDILPSRPTPRAPVKTFSQS
jgi:hypothetical protein